MNYNKEYLNIKKALIDSILVDISIEILDISYSVFENEILIQFILLSDAQLSDVLQSNIKAILKQYEIMIIVSHVSKEDFNQNKGNWKPIEYQWLDNILYSKSQVL